MESIIVRGAREHNLRNIDVVIPRNKLTVITGVSGSGKSSLAFDTVFAEGQRRYVESLSAYARQFLEQMEKPDVDSIEGLSPAISIEQKTTSKNPRSTVGTLTEIYDYMRLLWASVGQPHCTNCGKAIAPQSVQQMTERLMTLAPGTKFTILAPFVRGKKGEYRKQMEQLVKQGFTRAVVDGEMIELADPPTLDKQKKHDIDVVIDRLVMKEELGSRLAESLETASKVGSGLVKILYAEDGREELLSEKFSCPDCGVSIGEVTPRLFSFNSPYGACSACSGLGRILQPDPRKIIPDDSRSIAKGAIALWNEGASNWRIRQIEQLVSHLGGKATTPWSKLTAKIRTAIMEGSDAEMRFRYKGEKSRYSYKGTFDGLLPMISRRYLEAESDDLRSELEKFMTAQECTDCGGRRLKPEALAVTFAGKSIDSVVAMSLGDAREFFSAIRLSERDQAIAGKVLQEIRDRLHFLSEVGVAYLSLDRAAATLAGGEAQRIRLATQIGSRLMGVLYVLDEPSIGLHQRDNRRLLDALLGLRDLGNTVLVVEHDEETIATADHVIDLGPRAGEHGGEIVAEGTMEEVVRYERSLTADYLTGRRSIAIPEERREPGEAKLRILGARENNLKNIDVEIPLGLFVAVSGVSGSGKSTLVNEILYKAVAREIYRSVAVPGEHESIEGLDQIDKIINIDQSPIGRTPRSNPATYTGVFTEIRNLMSRVPEARMRGWKPGRFSFNVKGGRCESCRGDGQVKIEMHFLPDIYVTCEVCGGKRYNRETLQVHYKGLSISEILEMPVERALEVFENVPRIHRVLDTLNQVGLGYIRLGQPATTLSGGEAQRVKLAKELSKRSTGKTLYILDEPTTGLHFDDVAKLVGLMHGLVGKGNTVVIIEHNLDVLKTADWLIDLGPEGGRGGGKIVAQGSPEAVSSVSDSHTGLWLKRVFSSDRLVAAG
ncbi:MAG: excinuclease ABC subunit UvrA [Acidobacteria bacterium]|nr:excinuclease ABC subunit UvrA [Acidobacteriota bacterium]